MKRLYLLLFLLIPGVLALTFPDPDGYVMDTADVLVRDAEIEIMIAAIEKETTAEIAVVTIPTLENEDISTYSIKLAEHLKAGKLDTDNGLIILIVPQDRQYRIEVGYGLEGIIPDAVAGRIGREVFVPAFKRQAYDEGVITALQEIQGLLKKDPTIISKYNGGQTKTTAKVDWFNILIFLAIITFMIGSKSRLPFIFFPPTFPRGGSGGFNGGGFGGSGGFGGFGGGGFGGGGAGGRW